MNLCIFSGRFGADPETRYTADQMPVCRFRLAVARRYRKEGGPDADWLSMVAFGKNAENIQKYFSKGSPIMVESHVQTGSYTNRDNQKVYTTDYIVDSWEFCGGKGDGGGKQEKKADPAAGVPADGEFVGVPETGGLPWD